jgi:hypothetical protein
MDASDELKVWAADAIKVTLAMLPQGETSETTPEQRFDRFQMRMSLVMYSLAKHADFMPLSVSRFLN